MKNASQPSYFTSKAKAFSCETARKYSFRFLDGEITVFDKVADHFTTCHALTPRAINRLISIGEKA